MILGGEECAAGRRGTRPADAVPPRPLRPRTEPMPLRRNPSRNRKRGWGLFGRKKKDEPRIEPVPQPRSARAAPRPCAPQPQRRPSRRVRSSRRKIGRRSVPRAQAGRAVRNPGVPAPAVELDTALRSRSGSGLAPKDREAMAALLCLLTAP